MFGVSQTGRWGRPSPGRGKGGGGRGNVNPWQVQWRCVPKRVPRSLVGPNSNRCFGVLFFTALIFISTILTASAEVDVNVTAFGAVANDLVDDTAGIQAALDFAGTKGGGVVRFPAGRFRIGGRATVPDKVDLLGAGMTATTITCTANAAGIAFGDRQPHTTIPHGGKSGHFFMNGNGNAANPVYVGHQQGRALERIKLPNRPT